VHQFVAEAVPLALSPLLIALEEKCSTSHTFRYVTVMLTLRELQPVPVLRILQMSVIHTGYKLHVMLGVVKLHSLVSLIP